MDREQIESTVIAVLTSLLKCPIDFTITRQNTAQWDSLKHIEVMFALEEELNVQFSETQLVELDSVAGIVDAAIAAHAT